MTTKQKPRPPGKLAPHVAGLFAYLSRPDEKANEDLALQYFRHVFRDRFTRQSDAKRSDGYVPGHFVLELKGRAGDWHAGLLQGLAYHRELDFANIVVATKGFLAVWRVDDLPETLRDAVGNEDGPPNEVGRRLAKRLKAQAPKHRKLATWQLPTELFTDLFADSDRVRSCISDLENLLRSQQRVRLRVTPKNLADVIRALKPFFVEPIHAVRAFYSILFSWDAGSRVEISAKHPDQATLAGETVIGLVPDQRENFKRVIENHAVSLGAGESYDEFFAVYDRALDAADPSFRKRNGIFFTDMDLSKFVLWLTQQHLGDVGKNYIVIDPACGSGNLVTNWRAPLELRHKIVSEIEPELLFAIERRMKLDSWHDGKYTVVPKVSENIGLNFLDRDANTYLSTLKSYVAEKGHQVNKPLAFLCNPPFRNDDDQTATSISYEVHQSILDVVGQEAAAERYCCFLAQMKLVCRAAEESGLPGESLLLVFTKAAWMTDREAFRRIRSEVLNSFEIVAGVLVSGREFFDVSGRFPVAFTIWRHTGEAAELSSDRSIPLLDLTWMTKGDLATIPWGDVPRHDEACERLVHDKRSLRVAFGVKREKMLSWADVKRTDFQRTRRKAEHGCVVGGLPHRDRRESNQTVYGDTEGAWIGFMDDLTPCRISRDPNPGKPWFRLDAPFMDCRKSRCLSGPPDQKGFCASTDALTDKLFLWFSLQRTFADCGYPMWVDAMQLWPIEVTGKFADEALAMAYAIGLAENECIETAFPANNPVVGATEIHVSNPMSPLNPEGFWRRSMAPKLRARRRHLDAERVVSAVETLYRIWERQFQKRPSLRVSYAQAYFVGPGTLTKNAGILQIRHFADAHADAELLRACSDVQGGLKTLRASLHALLLDGEGLNYFAEPKRPAPSLRKTDKPPKQADVRVARRTKAK